MSATITRDEWIAELERVMRLQRSDSDGLSSQELAEAWGCCRKMALDRIKLLKGRLVVGRRRDTAVDGKACIVPTYKLLPAKAAKKR